MVNRITKKQFEAAKKDKLKRMILELLLDSRCEIDGFISQRSVEEDVMTFDTQGFKKFKAGDVNCCTVHLNIDKRKKVKK